MSTKLSSDLECARNTCPHVSNASIKHTMKQFNSEKILRISLAKINLRMHIFYVYKNIKTRDFSLKYKCFSWKESDIRIQFSSVLMFLLLFNEKIKVGL